MTKEVSKIEITGKVLKGNQLGRTINYPTINLDPNLVAKLGLQHGVYASQVEIANKQYLGALYFGPRLVLNETRDVLEIHLLNFYQEIYEQTIKFKVGKFVRGILNFSSFAELKSQLDKDINDIQKLGRQ